MNKTKKTKINICPHCGKNLEEVGIGAEQQGSMSFNLISDGENLNFETGEFEEENGDFEFFCKDCNAYLLLDYDEVKKIMKKYCNE